MKLSWQHVVVIGFVVIGMVTLAILDRDPTAFIGLAIAILVGVGLIQQGEIKNAANGTSSRMLSLMESMTQALAKATPPQPPAGPPATLVDSDPHGH